MKFTFVVIPKHSKILLFMKRIYNILLHVAFWILFAIIVIFTLITFRLSGRWVYYGGGDD